MVAFIEGMFTRAVQHAAGTLFHWMLDAVLGFFGWIGWPGVIAMASGSLLLLSLSAKAVKFINSPKGMATTAAVTLAALIAVWWLWPKPAAARELASYEPDARRYDGPRPKVKPAASPVLAAKPAGSGLSVARRADNVPMLTFNTPVLPILPPPLPLVAVPPVKPPVILHPKHEAMHHAAKPQEHASAARAEMPAARAATPQVNLAQQQQLAQKQEALRKAAAFQMQGLRQFQMQNARETAAMQQHYNAMMGGMERSSYGGGGHPGVVHHGGTLHHPGSVHHAGHR